MSRSFNMIENYIYFYHTNTFLILPVYPETLADSMGVSFSQITPLSRTAPIYSYSNSGPRSIQLNFKLHRDLMSQVNYGVSNVNLKIGDDYVDTLIKSLQAVALPRYVASSKMVNPPIVAVRIGNDIFCKGVVTGGISETYEAPILANNKYSQVTVSFGLNEIEPYDADTVMAKGSFRGLNTSLERNLWKPAERK